jgi:hypothetical protein
MTSAARLVLEDAEYALGQHRSTLQANAFRVSWFSVVTLLRSVGHVLDKVDGSPMASAAQRRAIDEKYSGLKATKPEPIIYWAFIETMRNDFLKEYKAGVKRTLPIQIDGTLHHVFDVGSGRGGFGLEGGAGMGPATRFVSRIVAGPYEGRAEAEVAHEAIGWWRIYLDEVDSLAAKHETSTSRKSI